MRILQKIPYVDSKGRIRVNFGDIVYKRRKKEAIPSYYYAPDELYCLIIKNPGKEVVLGGLNPFRQNREELRRLCYILKNGFPTPRNEGTWPIYNIRLLTDTSWEDIISVEDYLNILKWVDSIIERSGNKRIIDVKKFLNQNTNIC